MQEGEAQTDGALNGKLCKCKLNAIVIYLRSSGLRHKRRKNCLICPHRELNRSESLRGALLLVLIKQ
jgi:hypothetical protein